MMSSPAFPVGDYVSPGLNAIILDEAFPNMVVADKDSIAWQHFRRHVPHNTYVDSRAPGIAFLNRDETLLLYNNALQFKGQRALEIGCWLGWSACHLAAAGVLLDVVDPILRKPKVARSVKESLQATSRLLNVTPSIRLLPGLSPQTVAMQAKAARARWSFIHIDGDHEPPGPMHDTICCSRYAADDAMIIFHDLASPHVAEGLSYLKEQGWNTLVYNTSQILGVAWRGSVTPVSHEPDPSVSWSLPEHLRGHSVS